MRARRQFLLSAAALGLAGCGSTSSKFKSYAGPEVTQVFVNKSNRRLYLLNGKDVLRSYDIDLGFEPSGHKQERGDGRTPEGFYFIDRRNPNSAFHLSIGINYPNSRDIARAKAAGVDPGGDIFIHGEPNRLRVSGPDWTAGCIAVTNEEIEEIYAMVDEGTPIYISG